ncbi:MAG TPA: 6-bladed beta-propeller [Acidobacteriota bacterium]|nr:6-bladed beta-propeller [Acidobacteriota bacterium]
MSTNRFQSGIVCLWLLVFSIPSPARSQAQWKGAVVKEGDLTVVRNPKEPLYKIPILELKEELSLGGPDVQGDYAFVKIGDIVVDDSGSIYVLDQQDSHVKVFDTSGKYARTIGRQGQGPGEFEGPATLSLNRTAGELAVHQPYRMAFFKPDGTFLRDVFYRGTSTVLGRVDSRGHVYLTELVMDEQGPRFVVKKFGPDGSDLAEMIGSPAPISPKGAPRVKVKVPSLMPASYFQIDQADNIVYGYPQTYDLMLFRASDAKPFKKITLSYDPVEVASEEKKELEKQIPPGSGIELDFPKYHPAYSRFFLSDLGHLFVQTYEKADGGRFIHDIFDAEGRFIGRIPLKPSGVKILKGKYYALEEDEDGYQYVKRYAVTWKVR